MLAGWSQVEQVSMSVGMWVVHSNVVQVLLPLPERDSACLSCMQSWA
jgi:hypothetical protein